MNTEPLIKVSVGYRYTSGDPSIEGNANLFECYVASDNANRAIDLAVEQLHTMWQSYEIAVTSTQTTLLEAPLIVPEGFR